METMAPVNYAGSLTWGCDVDWLKIDRSYYAYVNAKSIGISFPELFLDRGFDHVRLRVRDYDLTGLLPKIVEVVNDCLIAGLTPILAFQGERFKMNPSPETQAEMVEWWRMIAYAFQFHRDRLSFNILIETTDAVRNNPQALNDLYAAVVPVIHEITPDRICIVCPCAISAPERLDDLIVPEGCFVEAHWYAAGPSKLQKNKLWTVGTLEEKQLFQNKVDLVTAWRAKMHIPVWVGAMMFSDFNQDDDTDNLTSSYSHREQAEFANFASKVLHAANIPAAFNSDTKFFNSDSNEWRFEQKIVLDEVFHAA
jgi:hypothetical protein